MKDEPSIKEMESNLFEAERELWHRQMLSAISHDLKTPLVTVIGSLEIYERMKDMLPPEKSATLIRTALEEAYRLNNFITNILDMAKLDSKVVQVRQEDCDVGALLRECVEQMMPVLHTDSIFLAKRDEDIRLRTDPALFCRMVNLLLDNAVRYAGHEAPVEIDYNRIDGHIVVDVMDQGPGIPPDKTEEIFSKYTRLKNKDYQNAGTGLGLSISRGLARLMGGDIIAANRDAGGARFQITLPQA